MYIKPLVEIAAFQLNDRLDQQQWPSDFLAKELENLPANLKDCLRKLYLKHRRLPQDAAKVNVYLPKLLHEKVLELVGCQNALDLECLAFKKAFLLMRANHIMSMKF